MFTDVTFILCFCCCCFNLDVCLKVGQWHWAKVINIQNIFDSTVKWFNGFHIIHSFYSYENYAFFKIVQLILDRKTAINNSFNRFLENFRFGPMKKWKIVEKTENSIVTLDHLALPCRTVPCRSLSMIKFSIRSSSSFFSFSIFIFRHSVIGFFTYFVSMAEI